MSTLSFDDSSNLVDVEPPANGEQKEEASGETQDKQPDLLMLDEPEIEVEDNITEHQEVKSKSKKSKAKKLFKRAKSPIIGAINKTTKEFKKHSNLPKHHHTQKSPVKSPSKENLTEEYSKLEQKLAEKDSEEWKQFMQMQARVQQAVLKTQSSLNKYSSHSEDEQPKESSKTYTTKWTGFEEEGQLEPEVIDTSLNPNISVSDSNDIINIDTIDLLDSKEDSSLINTSFIDSRPLDPIQSSPVHFSVAMESPNNDQKPPEIVPGDDRSLSLADSEAIAIETPNVSTNPNINQGIMGLDDFLTPSQPDSATITESLSDTPNLSGYTFSSPTPVNTETQEKKATIDDDILMFEKPVEEFTAAFKTPTTNTPIAPVQSDPVPIQPTPPVQTDPQVLPTPLVQSEPVAMQPTPPVQSEHVVIQPRPPVQSEPVPIQPTPAQASDDKDLFGLGNDAAPIQPAQTAEPKLTGVPETVIGLIGPPLQPIQPLQQTTQATQPTSVPDILDELSNKPCSPPIVTTYVDEFDSFDPMKQSSDMGQFGSLSSSVCVPSPSRSPINFPSQAQGMTYGSVPASNIHQDIFSKIKSMSGSQPVSPARKRAPEKPKDHFCFVKKELGAEEDEGYKSMADLKNKNIPQMEMEITQTTQPVANDNLISDNLTTDQFDATFLDNSPSNNPFMSESFNENVQTSNEFSSANAAALFGVEPENMQSMDTGFDIFASPNIEVKTENSNLDSWADLESTEPTTATKASTEGWVDITKTDEVDFGNDEDTKWEDDDGSFPKEKKNTVNAWGGDAGTESNDAGNPFNDDFSQLDDIPVSQQRSEVVNPFLSGNDGEVPAVSVSSVGNPFMNITSDSNNVQGDLLGGDIAQPVTLSDSESFFFDSVSDSQQTSKKESDDIFDPFNVATNNESGENAADPLDIFSSVAASGDKQLAKPSDDDHGFTLDIKPVEVDRDKLDNLPIAPALAPPPKAPKSPQPPRENPFDRDSPPEENFAQFGVKDTEKPKEPKDTVTASKSMSEESGTVTEEEEEDLPPLEPFLLPVEKDSFKLMLRYPTKKKLAGNRYWKNVCVKLEKQKEGLMIRVLNDARDPLPIQELLLQPCYSISELALQQYDQYGKIHTFKLQYVFYKERVGIKTERITPSIVKFKKRSEKPKATMILDHSPQVSELLKFGSLDRYDIMQFTCKLEDAFMNLEAHREKTLTYTKDEVTAEVRDEYYAELDKEGKVLMQKGRVRVFVLAFLSGMPVVEIGLNDKRRQGKEVVGRCDIIPIKTEEWIRMENVEFHGCVDKDEFEKTNNIKFRPLDACQFELMRYRVRLRENKELPLQLTIQQILKNRKCEVRCDLLVTGYHSYSKKHGQFPCEDIEVRFPIPEVWIYMFRYERRFGYGSVHSAARKPGKIKGLERLTMMAQGNLNQALMEADVGTAKYEHVYRAIVWRIPRLPLRNHGAYTSHLFRLKLELGPHDEIPTSFETHTNVSFTMPCSTVSQSQIRSIAVTNPNPPEKWVRSTARYDYRIEIEHLDEYPELLAIGTVYKEAAKTVVNAEENGEEEEEEEEERDPRLAKSDTDSSDSD